MIQKLTFSRNFRFSEKISKILAFVGATKFSSFTIRIRDTFDLDAFLILTDSRSDTVCISGTFDALASVIFADKSSRTKFSMAIRTYFTFNLKIGWFSDTSWKVILENDLIFKIKSYLLAFIFFTLAFSHFLIIIRAVIMWRTLNLFTFQIFASLLITTVGVGSTLVFYTLVRSTRAATIWMKFEIL